MRLTKDDKREIRDSIKEKLEEDFVENRSVWEESLKEINTSIEKEISSILIVTPFNKKMLFSYNELCRKSIYVIENIEIRNKSDVNPEKLSSKITNLVSDLKVSEIIEYYFKLGSMNL